MTIKDSRSLQRLKTVAVYHTCPTGSKVTVTVMSSLENMQQLALDTKKQGPSLLPDLFWSLCGRSSATTISPSTGGF